MRPIHQLSELPPITARHSTSLGRRLHHRFYGIIIAMYFDDHPPPHFHAKYGEYQAQIAIASGEVLNGELPRRARALVEEWTELHREALMADWELAVRQEPLNRIEPLP